MLNVVPVIRKKKKSRLIFHKSQRLSKTDQNRGSVVTKKNVALSWVEYTVNPTGMAAETGSRKQDETGAIVLGLMSELSCSVCSNSELFPTGGMKSGTVTSLWCDLRHVVIVGVPPQAGWGARPKSSRHNQQKSKSEPELKIRTLHSFWFQLYLWKWPTGNLLISPAECLQTCRIDSSFQQARFSSPLLCQSLSITMSVRESRSTRYILHGATAHVVKIISLKSYYI